MRLKAVLSAGWEVKPGRPDLLQAYFRPVAPERAHSIRRTACSCRYCWRSSPTVAASPSSVTVRNQRAHSMFVTSGRVRPRAQDASRSSMSSKWRPKGGMKLVIGNLRISAVFPSIDAGHETATRTWSAPVGHRQPRVADVPTSASLSILDQEDADVDSKIGSVCRGC